MLNDSALNFTSLIGIQNNITSGIFNGRVSFSSNDTIEPILKDGVCITTADPLNFPPYLPQIRSTFHRICHRSVQISHFFDRIRRRYGEFIHFFDRIRRRSGEFFRFLTVSVADPFNLFTFLTVSAKLEMTVRTSAVPNLLHKLGTYQEIDQTVLESLDYDFRLRPELTELVPSLFCGALLHDSITLLIITCEVYSRHSSVDIHSESTEFSIPSELSVYKYNMSCTTYEKSDGGAMKLKLIIGTKTINLLITCSAEISNELRINIGPGVEFGHGSITDSSCKIYLMKSKVEEFLKSFESFKSNPSKINISNLRQVTSSFGKCSSYLLWRSTLQEFDSSIYSPATVFTLCDLPNKDGYGVGSTSGTKLSSNILQIFAKSILVNKGTIQSSNFSNILMEYDNIMKQKADVKEWSSIIKVINEIKETLNSGETNVISFCNSNVGAVSEIASKLSSSISTANNMIAKNIKKKLLQLYQ